MTDPPSPGAPSLTQATIVQMVYCKLRMKLLYSRKNLGAVANYRHFFFQTNDVRLGGGGGGGACSFGRKIGIKVFWTWLEVEPSSGRRAGRANATRG